MKHRQVFLRFLAAIMAFALVGAACSSANDAGDATSDSATETSEEPSSEETGTTTETETVDLSSGAPALTQGLTDLLDSHVYLASIAVAVGLNSGLDSDAFKAAAGALDTNSQDLAGAIESVYGPEAGEAFLKQWREHIGFFVEYTQGKATGDDKLAKSALKKLSNYKKDFSAFLESATEGGLPASGAADALQMHVDSLTKAIDAAVAGDPKVFDLIYEAAHGHMPMTASALAGAIVQQFPDKF